MSMGQYFQEFLQVEADKHNLSKAEREVLVLALEGNDIAGIAEQLQVKDSAIRQRLSAVYQKFQIDGKGPVKFAKLRQFLLSQYQKHQAQNTASMSSPSVNFGEDHIYARQDWDEAPDVTIFYGRDRDEEGVDFKVAHTFAAFLDQVESCGAEYYYIMRDGVWYCGSPDKGSQLVPLTEALVAIQETEHA